MVVNGIKNLVVKILIREEDLEKLESQFIFNPEEITDVEIKLTLKNSKFTCIYPKFNESENTWKVKAFPNEEISILDKKYPYLFWEVDSYVAQDLSKGFVVKARIP